MKEISREPADLLATELFRDATPDDLAALGPATRQWALDRGETLDPTDGAVSVVVEGAIGLYHPSAGDGRILLAELGPGDSFGEFAVISGETGVTTAEAKGPAVLARVPGEAFRAYLQANPAASYRLLRKLVGIVRSMDRRLSEKAGSDQFLASVYNNLVRFTL